MTDELRRLIAKAERIARTGERISAAFAVELLEVWRRVERQLSRALIGTRQPARNILGLRKRVRDVLVDAGYDALAGIAGVSAVDGMAAAVGTLDIPRAALEARLSALRQAAAGSLLARGDEAANNLWRAVSQRVIAGRDTRVIITELADQLDIELRHVRTLFDTAVSVYGRQVEALRSESLPEDQPYLYSGPIDGKTRDWCVERVGKVFTRAEIDAMDNGQMADVFLTGGGYNCRHSFMAVESRALRDLVGTGERADGYQPEIERVEAWKAKQKERRKAA